MNKPLWERFRNVKICRLSADLGNIELTILTECNTIGFCSSEELKVTRHRVMANKYLYFKW